MLERHGDKKEHLQFLEPFLEREFLSATVSWILAHPMDLDIQSWEFVCHLENHPVLKHQERMLRLQSVVRLSSNDFADFIIVSKVAL